MVYCLRRHLHNRAEILILFFCCIHVCNYYDTNNLILLCYIFVKSYIYFRKFALFSIISSFKLMFMNFCRRTLHRSAQPIVAMPEQRQRDIHAPTPCTSSPGFAPPPPPRPLLLSPPPTFVCSQKKHQTKQIHFTGDDICLRASFKIMYLLIVFFINNYMILTLYAHMVGLCLVRLVLLVGRSVIISVQEGA